MGDRKGGWVGARSVTRESGSIEERKPTELLDFSPQGLGQRCPSHCPHSDEPSQDGSTDVLGDPLTIREVAALIGCSVWTVRQRCLREGLPHFRPSRTGKLIFYRTQVLQWLFDKQKGRR